MDRIVFAKKVITHPIKQGSENDHATECLTLPVPGLRDPLKFFN